MLSVWNGRGSKARSLDGTLELRVQNFAFRLRASSAEVSSFSLSSSQAIQFAGIWKLMPGPGVIVTIATRAGAWSSLSWWWCRANACAGRRKTATESNPGKIDRAMTSPCPDGRFAFLAPDRQAQGGERRRAFQDFRERECVLADTQRCNAPRRNPVC